MFFTKALVLPRHWRKICGETLWEFRTMVQAFTAVGLEDQIVPSSMRVIGATGFALKIIVAIWCPAAGVITVVKK